MTDILSEFVPGEDVTGDVTPGTRGGVVVSVRLAPEDADRLVKLAEESGKTVSQVAREALRAFVSRGGQPSLFDGEWAGISSGPLVMRTAHWADTTAGPTVTQTDELDDEATVTSLAR